MPINLPSVWRDEDEPDFFHREPDYVRLPSGDPDWPTCPEHDITYHVSSSCGMCRMEASQRMREQGEARRRHNQRLHDGGM